MMLYKIYAALFLGITFFSLAYLYQPNKLHAKESDVSSAPQKSPLEVAKVMNSLEGKEIKLEDKYKNKVVLIVNVASRCGLTGQYQQLQELHEKYAETGLAVLGFPCNQFGKQEPGTSNEIQEFCQKNYGVEFDMFEKIDVNGEDACDLYKHLTKLDTKPKGAGKISWNFEKFLVGRDGTVIARFGPMTSPTSKKVVSTIEAAL